MAQAEFSKLWNFRPA